MKFKDTSLNATRLEIIRCVKLMTDNCQFVRTQQGKGSPGIPKVFRELVLDGDYQERGEILTPVMQLPPHIRPLLMEYINHEGPWANSLPIDLYITLRNNDTKAHRAVIYDCWWQPGINDAGQEVLEDGFMVYEKATVGPGETIELTPHWAAKVLRKYCKRACNPQYWNNWDGIGIRDCWEEVGFRVNLPKIDKLTERVRVNTLEAKPKKRRKAPVQQEAQVM
jgi:hypothetical protein